MSPQAGFLPEYGSPTPPGSPRKTTKIHSKKSKVSLRSDSPKRGRIKRPQTPAAKASSFAEEDSRQSPAQTPAVPRRKSERFSIWALPGAFTRTATTLSLQKPAPNRAVTIGISITTILVVFTIAFLYLWPRYSRGGGFLSTSTTVKVQSTGESSPPSCIPPSSQLAVQLADGTVFGTESVPAEPSELPVRLFFGIRYAASTAGNRRFARAVASARRHANATFHAYEHGPPCAHFSPGRHAPVGSEDCLTLSIWAPFFCQPTDPLKTVVVALSTNWFQTGHVTDYQDSWRQMAARGNVVVVALNVRLGVLGYLRTPISEEAPGNAAFTDVAVALSWIDSNVAAFYGDTTQMVALGVGGGGLLLATDFLADPYSTPRFKRFVLHGLSPTSLLPRNDIADARSLAERLNCSVDADGFTNETLSCLKDYDLENLVRESRTVSHLGFVPSREVKPLSFDSSVKNAAARPLKEVSVLCGYSLKDGLAYVDDATNRTNVTQEGVKPGEMMVRAARFFGHSNGTGSTANLPDDAKSFLGSLNRSGVHRLLVDAIYHCPLQQLVSEVAGRRALAYFYVYTDSGPFKARLYFTELLKFVTTG
ncbi:hypothetical protein HPB49_017021 [Dermacentor silvarum]|uniref:Uncharacterized protein n=1 Tax=Dermacentor silvarum TaxID=543639 RepID=A0ACB8D6Z3_DERSI|nr:hypothetical protein HPB49_017021 [Dermacentor silvarum]